MEKPFLTYKICKSYNLNFEFKYLTSIITVSVDVELRKGLYVYIVSTQQYKMSYFKSREVHPSTPPTQRAIFAMNEMYK